MGFCHGNISLDISTLNYADLSTNSTIMNTNVSILATPRSAINTPRVTRYVLLFICILSYFQSAKFKKEYKKTKRVGSPTPSTGGRNRIGQEPQCIFK